MSEDSRTSKETIVDRRWLIRSLRHLADDIEHRHKLSPAELDAAIDATRHAARIIESDSSRYYGTAPKPERDRAIVQLFGLEWKPVDIARAMGISRQRVDQILIREEAK